MSKGEAKKEGEGGREGRREEGKASHSSWSCGGGDWWWNV